MSKIILTSVALLALAGAAQAATRSSFLQVSAYSGITVVSSNAGLSYTVSLSPSATFTYNSASYSITDIMGFYLLDDAGDFSPLPALANFGPPGTFSDDSSNSGTGAVAGWKSVNANAGLGVGDTLTFTFPSNFPLASADRLGFHVRLTANFPGTTGLTGNITTAERIPTPGTMGLALAGLLAVSRRRR